MTKEMEGALISNCNVCMTRINMIGRCDLGTPGCGDPACACQHGHPMEMSPFAGDDQFHGYLDGLPADDPRRKAYEEKVRREIPGGARRLPGPEGAMEA